MRNQVVTSASPEWTRWLERMSSWLALSEALRAPGVPNDPTAEPRSALDTMPWRARLKSGSPLRGRSDFSIDRLDSAPPRQELSLRDITDFSVRSLRQPADALAGRLRRIPRIKTLRCALALTQEEFAARFKIPLGTLRDWEQGRSEPDQPAKAYLTVIARDPQGVERALHPVRS